MSERRKGLSNAWTRWRSGVTAPTGRAAASIIPAMTERGLPSADTSPACPFVAFEDDRDERADRPDHRHRCYAEAEPAPRAIAHQEAYCLSSAFPVCPVFQEWARREAARARSGDPTPAAAPPAPPPIAPPPGDPGAPQDSPPPIESTPRRNPRRDWAAPPPWAGGRGGPGGAPGPGAGNDGPGRAVPDFLAPRGGEGQGLAGSAADRIASGGSPLDGTRSGGMPSTTAPSGMAPGAASAPGPASTPGAASASGPGSAGPAAARPPMPSQPRTGSPADAAAVGGAALAAGAASAAGRPEERSIGPDADLAELLRRSEERQGPGTAASSTGASGRERGDPDERLAREREDEREAEADEYARAVGGLAAGRGGKRPTVSSTRGRDADRDRDRERETEPRREPRRERVQGGDAPSWERSRRYEAYPTIKTRSGLPGMPRLSRVVLLAGALALAAVAVFFLPAFLGVGGDDEPDASAAPSATTAIASASPSPTPEPEPTAQTYVIKEGDTLSKVAREFGLTLDQLLAANTETIADPDRIAIGDEIIIPVPPPDEVGGEESAEPAESPAP